MNCPVFEWFSPNIELASTDKITVGQNMGEQNPYDQKDSLESPDYIDSLACKYQPSTFDIASTFYFRNRRLQIRARGPWWKIVFSCGTHFIFVHPDLNVGLWKEKKITYTRGAYRNNMYVYEPTSQAFWQRASLGITSLTLPSLIILWGISRVGFTAVRKKEQTAELFKNWAGLV